MTRLARLSSFLLCVILCGCTIGNGRICGPQTPRLYCDHDAYQRLMKTLPHSDRWERAGTTTEDRRIDWVECGGNQNGNYSSGPDDPSKTTKENIDASREKLRRIGECMQSRGYQRAPPESIRP